MVVFTESIDRIILLEKRGITVNLQLLKGEKIIFCMYLTGKLRGQPRPKVHGDI